MVTQAGLGTVGSPVAWGACYRGQGACRAGQGHPLLDELSATSITEVFSQPCLQGNTKALNAIYTPMIHKCLSLSLQTLNPRPMCLFALGSLRGMSK
jgi:hypothetical protein